MCVSTHNYMQTNMSCDHQEPIKYRKNNSMQTQLPSEWINSGILLPKSVFTMTSNSVKRQLNADEMVTPVKRKKTINEFISLQDDGKEDGRVPRPRLNLTQHECEVMTSYIDLQFDNENYHGKLLKDAFDSPYGIKRGFTARVRSSSESSEPNPCNTFV